MSSSIAEQSSFERLKKDEHQQPERLKYKANDATKQIDNVFLFILHFYFFIRICMNKSDGNKQTDLGFSKTSFPLKN